MSFKCRFFLNRFPACFNLFVLPFLVTPCLVVAVQPCMERIPIKKKKKKKNDGKSEHVEKKQPNNSSTKNLSKCKNRAIVRTLEVVIIVIIIEIITTLKANTMANGKERN